jgi:DNA-binding response OmpR family regulator
MPRILLVADAATIFDEVRAAIDDGETEFEEVRTGEKVVAAAGDFLPDLVVTDSQVQNMGGVAVAYDLVHEETGGRLPHIPVLLLLDRRADVFLARRARVAGYLVKPLDPIRLRRAAEALLAGGRFEDRSFEPLTLSWR